MKKIYYSTILFMFANLCLFAQPQVGIEAIKNTKVVVASTQVGPLLRDATLGKDIMWDQEAPYNNQCPMIGTQRALVGCGATAVGQIMRYFRYPEKGIGSNGGINFAEQTYNYDLMLPTYSFDKLGTTEEKAEVAKFLFHVGKGMNMVYSTTGSGSSLRQIADATTKYFGYKGKLALAYRLAYTDSEWFDVIKREIDAGRPVAYNGYDGNGGAHLFVCDGYDPSNKTLHFNYGWDGRWNDWKKITACMFPNNNAILLGLSPEVVAANIEPNPSIVMVTPIQLSNYSVAKNTVFSGAIRVSNYGVGNYTKSLGIALYKGTTLVKTLGLPINVNMAFTDPLTTNIPNYTYDYLFPDLKIDNTVAAGDYQLRVVAQLSNNSWVPIQGLVKDMFKEINVKVGSAGVELSYPIGDEQVDLSLAKKLEVVVANNRATATFTLQNNDQEYDCKTDVYIVASPNNLLIPVTWQKVNVTIDRGLTKDIVVSDIQVPPGTTINSCRFSVMYNRILTQINDGREVSCVPLLPSSNNFVEYTIPKESETFALNFNKTTGKPLPIDYKVYDSSGVEDVDKKLWGLSYMGTGTTLYSYAGTKAALVKLVTTAIDIEDENAVLEWYRKNMSSATTTYRVYISTEGQDYKYFKDLKPIYDKPLPNNSIARIGLSEYAGQKIYIAFENVEPQVQVSLEYFKILNIKNSKDIVLQNVIIPGTSTADQSVLVKMMVKNNSAVNVKEVKASYTIGSTKVEEVIKTDIPFNEAAELSFKKPLTLKGNAGDLITVNVRVDQVGETGDALKNNDATANCMIVNFYPKKGMTVFKTSKIGCPACMSSYSVMDNIDQIFPEASSGVEIWRDGSFKCPGFEAYTGGNTPSFHLNANFIPEYTPFTVPSAARRYFKTLSPPADVFVQANYENADSRKLIIKVSSRFATPLKGNYRLGAFIIENNVINIDGQIAGTHPTGDKLTKNHIPIAAMGGCDGASGTLIANPTVDGEYIYECDYTIPAELRHRYRKDNIQVIGVLFDANGKILNSSVSNYYIRLPKTDGLTFIAEKDSSPFKLIYDVEEDNNNFVSVEYFLSNIPSGDSFKFKIEKDASWDNKNLQLVANPKAAYNLVNDNLKNEVLFPDANGVYTIDNVEMNYYMRVEIVPSGGALLAKNGTELVMSGNWTTADFNKLDLSSSTLTGVDMTAIQIPSSISELNIANPNMLIYVAMDAVVPASWKNVVREQSEMNNIELKDGYPFYNSKEFTAAYITYERNYQDIGYVSTCLPFALVTVPSGIQMERYARHMNSWNEIHFEKISSTEANMPYIFSVGSVGEIIFGATNTIVPVTTTPEKIDGSYAFKGSFNAMAGADVEGLYLLNFDGKKFIKADATTGIPAFRSYLRSVGSDGISADKITVLHKDNGMTGVNLEKADDELIIRSLNGVVEIITAKAQTIRIYGIDGCLVRILNLTEGVNTVTDLGRGIYLVGNRKIVVR